MLPKMGGTTKPDWVARFGGVPVSRWSLPLPVLWHKLRVALGQSPRRWLPFVFRSQTFMEWRPPGHQ